MLKPEDFLLEDLPDEKERKTLRKCLEGVKTVAMGLLAKALALYKRASRGDPNPMLAGKAIAYLSSFQELAPALGIKEYLYKKVVSELWEKLGKLAIHVDEHSKKTVILHKRDERGLELEAQKLEFRREAREKACTMAEIKVEDDRPDPSALAEGSENLITEAALWLERSLGYEKKDAERRARLAWKSGIRLEELVAAGCRI